MSKPFAIIYGITMIAEVTQLKTLRRYGLLFLAFGLLLQFTLTPYAWARDAALQNPFDDVRPGTWYHDAVQYMAEHGMMQGTAAAAFSPNTILDRRTMVTVLHRMAGAPSAAFEPVFDDVAPGQWYSEAVMWAKEHGIVSGISDTHFAPTDPLTREQLAAMLFRYAEHKGYPLSTPVRFPLDRFSDIDQLSAWAYPAVRWAVYYGLILGDDGQLLPHSSGTRASVAVILHRLRFQFEYRLPLPAPTPAVQHDIPWQFLTYLTPDFTAGHQESLPPQTVTLIRRMESGWALITTEQGNRWVFLPDNRRFIADTIYLYEERGGPVIGQLEAQVVSVLEQDGDWLRIGTSNGPKWIHLAVSPPPANGPRIALTFDDGPSIHTQALLDALYERGVPATFFVLGQRVAARPDLAQRIVAEGHEIGNHSFSHLHLTQVGTATIRNELLQTRRVIEQATGVQTTLFRPPYGSHNATVRTVAAEFGYPLILWSVDTRDWERRDVNAILRHFFHPNGQARVQDGDVILMHDIFPTTVEAAIIAVDRLLEQGFVFVTTSELLLEHHDTLVPGRVYSRAR